MKRKEKLLGKAALTYKGPKGREDCALQEPRAAFSYWSVLGNSAGREKAGELGRGCLAGLRPGLRFWSFKRHWNHNGFEGRR